MRVSEIYPAMQGEGPHVGCPTIFTRFAGCNLRCPGWPCDTQHAIDPEKYRHEWKSMSPGEVFATQLQPIFNKTGATNICLTGGEPFIQQDTELFSLIDMCLEQGFTVECFSNGTIEYPEWAPKKIEFVMDWKLPGSGEDPYDNNRLINLYRLANYRGPLLHSVKFVISDRRDFDLAHTLFKEYQAQLLSSPIEVFAGVVWGKLEDKQLIDWIFEERLPWRLNVQTQNYLFDRNQRGI